MFKQLRFLLIIGFCIVFVFASCDRNSSTQSASSDQISTSPGSETADSTRHYIIGSNLLTLWIDSSGFSKLDKRDMALRFFIDSNENLLMNGWTVKSKGGYTPNPNLSLSKGRASKLIYQTGNYLGNLLLSKDNIKNIQDSINFHHSKYVLFQPISRDTGALKGQVIYEIVLTNDDPHPEAKVVLRSSVSTNVITNPSPPGTAN